MSDVPNQLPAYVTANYYYLANKIIYGPVTAQKIQELYQAQALQPVDPIWIDSIDGNGTPLQQTELGQVLSKNLPLPKATIRFNNVTEGMLQPLVDRPKFLPLAEEAPSPGNVPFGSYQVRAAPRIGQYPYADLKATSLLFLVLLTLTIFFNIAMVIYSGTMKTAVTTPNNVAPLAALGMDADDAQDPWQWTPANPQPAPYGYNPYPTPTMPVRNNLARIDNTTKYLLIVGLLLVLICSVMYYAWLYQAYQNLYALGADALSFTPGWAVGCHFVPFLNLWKPFQALSQLGSASINVRRWAELPMDPLAGIYWLLMVLQMIFGYFAGNTLGRVLISSDPTLLADALTWLQITLVLGDLALLVLMGIVFTVMLKQQQQYKKSEGGTDFAPASLRA